MRARFSRHMISCRWNRPFIYGNILVKFACSVSASSVEVAAGLDDDDDDDDDELPAPPMLAERRRRPPLLSRRLPLL